MAKSSFASQLAKGFVRAAVNQVGRDGGRVVSNKIYKGENYVPVAGVTPNQEQSVKIPSDAVCTTKPFSKWKIFILAVVSVIATPISAIGVLIYGFCTYRRTTDKMVWQELRVIYTSDKRYKSGARSEGSYYVKKSQKVPATEENMEIHRRNGVAAMIASAVGFAYLLIILIFG